MRFTIPITISKAGAPVTPHLVSVHLGGSSNVDALGYMKADGTIVLFQMGGAAVILDQSGKINFGVDYNEEYCFFGQDSEQAYTEFAGQYEWMVPSLALEFDISSGKAYDTIYIADPETGDNLLIAYDVCVDKNEGNIALPLDFFIPEIDVDPESAFITSCEVDGFYYLALAVNGIVRPICDVGGNMGAEMTQNGASFNVPNCSNVRGAGQEIVSIPAQVAFCTIWSARSCSVNQGIVTTSLKTSVMMLNREWLILTPELTAPAGDWYIQPSDFSVGEA